MKTHKHSTRIGSREFLIATLCVAAALALFSAGDARADNTWRPVADESLDQVFVVEDSTLATFTHYRIEPIGVWHYAETTNTNWVEQIRATIDAQLSAQFRAAGLAPTANDTATTLVVRVQLVDLATHTPVNFNAAESARYAFSLAPGCITLVAEMAAGDGRPLLRMADMRQHHPDSVDLGTWLEPWTHAVNTTLASTGLAPSRHLHAAL